MIPWIPKTREKVIKKIRGRISSEKYQDEISLMRAKNALYLSELRRNPTKAEIIFGDYLYKRGVRFIFQKGFFTPFHRIVDFYIPVRKICIEVDGSSHLFKQDIDYRRDKWFIKERGFTFIRIDNYEVYTGRFKDKIKCLFTK